jgi:hypothetical protein
LLYRILDQHEALNAGLAAARVGAELGGVTTRDLRGVDFLTLSTESLDSWCEVEKRNGGGLQGQKQQGDNRGRDENHFGEVGSQRKRVNR